MSDQFQPYPHAAGSHGVDDSETPKDHVILVSEHGEEATFADPSHASELMTESQALAALEHIAQRRQNGHALVESKDQVIQVSDRELVIYRSSAWTGDRVTRVICGRSR